MSHSNCITPRLGLRTATVAAAWIGGVYLVSWYHAQAATDLGNSISLGMVSSMLWVGSLYGVTAWICWLCTGVPSTLQRSLLRWGALLAGSYLIARHQGNDQWLKFMINLGGMMIGQSILFFLFWIPGWQLGTTRREVQTRQFSIGEVLIGTTGVALLLGLAIRFQTPINARAYWLVLMGLWVLFPAISASACMAALRKDPFQQLLFFAIAAMLAFGGAGGGAYFERAFAESPDIDSTRFAVGYGMIALGNLAVMFVLPLAGRWDSRAVADAGQQANDEHP